MNDLTDVLDGMVDTDMTPQLETIPLSTLPRAAVAQPAPQWVRGRCPQCGGSLVSTMYWRGDRRGWAIIWGCWNRRVVDNTAQTCLAFVPDLALPRASCHYARIV